jgi:hypothetical protein
LVASVIAGSHPANDAFVAERTTGVGDPHHRRVAIAITRIEGAGWVKAVAGSDDRSRWELATRR